MDVSNRGLSSLNNVVCVFLPASVIQTLRYVRMIHSHSGARSSCFVVGRFLSGARPLCLKASIAMAFPNRSGPGAWKGDLWLGSFNRSEVGRIGHGRILATPSVVALCRGYELQLPESIGGEAFRRT